MKLREFIAAFAAGTVLIPWQAAPAAGAHLMVLPPVLPELIPPQEEAAEHGEESQPAFALKTA